MLELKQFLLTILFTLIALALLHFRKTYNHHLWQADTFR